MYAAAGQAIRQARKGKKSSGSTGATRQISQQALLAPTLQADNISVRHLRVGSAIEVPKCIFSPLLICYLMNHFKSHFILQNIMFFYFSLSNFWNANLIENAQRKYFALEKNSIIIVINM